ncbi:outer membrane lipoprotein-sorting protein [Sporohalobacter salinus]|uniref:outer membrane lipoprotein-sorting protein n=1 Tax=Sporohalobacter salinus TaxID=1494606 RepID=UPI001960BA34|nr:outer membrane lipoprotein-sorting protein [Sporohalobacter salinus]MBM7624446.1 outer membrane lipoprotein-sorting protein [Sporohalobacter salinus]
MKKRLIISLILVSFFVGIMTFTTAANFTGDDILTKIYTVRDAKSLKLMARMELYDSNDDKLEYELKWISKNAKIDKSLIKLLAPDDLEGTTFLTKSKEGTSKEMYIYLSALDSLREISDSQQNNSFLKTDFTYNDLAILNRQNYERDYRGVILKETNQKYLLQIIPINADIEYNYGKMWVTKKNWYPVKIKFYDENSKLYKVLTNKQIKKVNGYWIAKQIVMKNYQKGSKTILYLDEIDYDQKIDNQLFRESKLSTINR